MPEFEINVKQTQSGSSIKDAGNDLRDLKTITADTKRAGVDVGESFEQTGRKISATTGVMSGAMRLLKGDMTGIVQIGQSIRGLFAGIGPLIAVIGSGLAGWKLGAIVREWLELKTTTFDTAEAVTKTKEEFEKVNKVKLDALAKEIATIKQGLKDTLGDLDKVYAMRRQEANAAIERDLAKTRAEPQSPDRDRRIADLEKAKAQKGLSFDVEQNVMNLQELEPARKKIQDQIAALEADLAGLEAKRQAGLERIKGATPGDKGAMAKQLNAELWGTESASKDALEKARKELKDIDQQIAQERSNRRVQNAQRDTIVYERQAKEAPIVEQEQKLAKQSAEDAERAKAADAAEAFSDSMDRLPEAKANMTAAQRRLAAAKEHGGTTFMNTAQKAELAAAQKAVQDQAASLQQIVALIEQQAANLKELRDQIKNSGRD
jgi:hypothetical protein